MSSCCHKYNERKRKNKLPLVNKSRPPVKTNQIKQTQSRSKNDKSINSIEEGTSMPMYVQEGYKQLNENINTMMTELRIAKRKDDATSKYSIDKSSLDKSSVDKNPLDELDRIGIPFSIDVRMAKTIGV